MIAIAGGLGAALAWAASTLFSARASRTIGVFPTLAWVMFVGLVPSVPAVLAVGGRAPHSGSLGWLAASGCGNVAEWLSRPQVAGILLIAGRWPRSARCEPRTRRSS